MTQTTNTGLHSKALIVNLNISQWSGRKHDKNATREVEEAHNAQTGQAGRFNKMLTSKEFLAGILNRGSAARSFLYEQTLPWGDNGDRILPSAIYFDFITGMDKLKTEFFEEVDKAENEYNNELREAEARLNGLFNASDYPSSEEFKSKFGFKISFMPIPETQDLRIDLSQTEINVLKQSITTEMNNRLAASMADVWQRIKEQLDHMKERLTGLNDKGKVKSFNDSLFTNLSDIIDLLPKLNIAGSPDIDQICEELKSLMVEPDKVRTNALLRSRKAAEIDNVLNKFENFF